MKITLVAGRAHNKHTEGGDFRQATYRALRQGLMEASCILLEPWYTFRLEVPEASIGRAMTDIEKRCGTCVIEENRQGQAVRHGDRLRSPPMRGVSGRGYVLYRGDRGGWHVR